jgi:hypothetical protein
MSCSWKKHRLHNFVGQHCLDQHRLLQRGAAENSANAERNFKELDPRHEIIIFVGMKC